MFRLIFQSMFMTLFKNFSENIQMQTGERSHPIQICSALAGNVAYYKVNNYKKITVFKCVNVGLLLL